MVRGRRGAVDDLSDDRAGATVLGPACHLERDCLGRGRIRTADDEATQDVADRAASSYNKEFLFSQSNNDRQLLNMVDGALARIREGSFGECVSCGKEINAKRLEAVPWTRHCIECQEKAEKGLLEAAQ